MTPPAFCTAWHWPYSHGWGPSWAREGWDRQCDHCASLTSMKSSSCRPDAKEHTAVMWAVSSDEHTSSRGLLSAQRQTANEKEKNAFSFIYLSYTQKNNSFEYCTVMYYCCYYDIKNEQKEVFCMGNFSFHIYLYNKLIPCTCMLKLITFLF